LLHRRRGQVNETSRHRSQQRHDVVDELENPDRIDVGEQQPDHRRLQQRALHHGRVRLDANDALDERLPAFAHALPVVEP